MQSWWCSTAGSSRWRRAWQASTHAVCSALHAEQRGAFSPIHGGCRHLAHRVSAARTKESPSCRHRPWRSWTRSGGEHTCTTSNQRLYMHSKLVDSQKITHLSSPPSPSPSSRSWSRLHALQPAAQRSNADTLLCQLPAPCWMLTKQSLTRWDQRRQLQRVRRDDNN